MGFLSDKCPNCGEKLKKGDRFCSKCGAPAPGGTGTCQTCGKPLKVGDKYCAYCRAEARIETPVLRDNIWSKTPDEFAIRIETDDVQGFFKKGLTIEPNTKAIFIVDGKVEGILGSGKYDMGGLFKRISTLGAARRSVALVVDEHDVELAIELPRVYTSDPVGLTFNCHLVLRVEDPLLFVMSQLKGKKSFTKGDLKALLYDELKWHFDAAINGRSVQELNDRVELRNEFELSIGHALKQTFSSTGLGFVRVKIIDCTHERLDKARGTREETYLLITEEEAKLDGKRRLFDTIKNPQEMEDLRESEQRLRNHERRLDILNRWQQVTNSAEMDRVRNADQLEEFLFETAKDKEARELIGEDRIAELKHTIDVSETEREMGLRHLRQKIALEQEQELAWIKAIGDQKRGEDVEMSDLLHRIKMERERFAAAVEKERERSAAARETKGRDFDEELREREAAAKEKEERARRAQELLKSMKANKREDEEERRRIDREDTESRSDAAHRRQLEMLEAMSGASMEALISMSGPQQAAMLADLKKTEALKGVSEETILAMAAENSAAVADAFKEKFSAAAAQQREADVTAMFEKMLEAQKASGDQLSKVQREYAEMMMEMFKKGMETQRDTASTAAGRGGASIVYPPSSGVPSTVDSAGRVTSGRVVLCPHCRAEVLETEAYCGNCGKKLRD